MMHFRMLDSGSTASAKKRPTMSENITELLAFVAILAFAAFLVWMKAKYG
jgi:hypothetical protein